jgi:hypothetical protein
MAFLLDVVVLVVLEEVLKKVLGLLRSLEVHLFVPEGLGVGLMVDFVAAVVAMPSHYFLFALLAVEELVHLSALTALYLSLVESMQMVSIVFG